MVTFFVYLALLLVASLTGVGVVSYVRASKMLAAERQLLKRSERDVAQGKEPFANMGEPAKGGETSPLLLAKQLQAQLRVSGASASGVDCTEQVANLLDDRVMIGRRIFGVLVFVALVGTLSGLMAGTIQLSNLPQLKKVEDISVFVSKAHQLLAEFGYAFAATIGGVIGTLILSVLDYFYSREANAFLLDCNRFLNNELRPYLLSKLHIVTPESFTQRASDVLRAMADDMPQAAKELMFAAKQSTVAAVRTREMVEAAAAATGSLQQSMTALAALPSSLEEHLRRLEDAHRDAISSQEQWAERSLALSESTSETSAQAATQLLETSNALQLMYRQTEVYAEQAQNLAASLTQGLASAEQFEANARSIAGGITRASNNLAETTRQIEAAISKLESALQVLINQASTQGPVVVQSTSTTTDELLRQIIAKLDAIGSSNSRSASVPHEVSNSGSLDSLTDLQRQSLEHIKGHLELDRQFAFATTQKLDAVIQELRNVGLQLGRAERAKADREPSTDFKGQAPATGGTPQTNGRSKGLFRRFKR